MVTIVRRARAAALAIRRMPRILGVMLGLGATLGVAGGVVAVAGGGGMPGNAVATVGGEPIDREAFGHWLSVAAGSGGRADTKVPEPPDFVACVADKRKSQAKPTEGKPKTELTDTQLEQQCRRDYEDLRDRALQLLISQRWIEGEARELGISISDADVKKSFEEQRKRSFPEDRDYRKWLADSNQTEEDIVSRVRVDLLSNRIRARMPKGDDKVTEKQIAGYYAQNKARFGKPATRDARLVLTQTRAKAELAMRALRGGASWRSVARRYSIDDATRRKGGKLTGAVKGQQEPALDEALFEAPKGRLTGPVKTQFGWYAVEVLRAERGSQQTLAQAKPSIRELLIVERRQKQLTEYIERFREKWRARTECRRGYVIQDCKNAPKPTPAPSMR